VVSLRPSIDGQVFHRGPGADRKPAGSELLRALVGVPGKLLFQVTRTEHWCRAAGLLRCFHLDANPGRCVHLDRGEWPGAPSWLRKSLGRLVHRLVRSTGRLRGCLFNPGFSGGLAGLPEVRPVAGHFDCLRLVERHDVEFEDVKNYERAKKREERV